ncbi:hypothetical protein ACWCV9_10375 [Streptomyces sp. NPDC001606]
MTVAEGEGELGVTERLTRSRAASRARPPSVPSQSAPTSGGR